MEPTTNEVIFNIRQAIKELVIDPMHAYVLERIVDELEKLHGKSEEATKKQSNPGA